MTSQNWGLALVHFGWQGLLVAVLLRTALATVARRSAELRYAVCVGGLVLMATLPALTFVTLESRSGERDRSEIRAAASTLHQESPTRSDAETATGYAPARSVGNRTAGTRTASEGSGTRAGGAVSATAARWDSALGWVVALWLAGVALLTVRLLGGWVRLSRLARTGGDPVPPRVAAIAHRLASRLSVSKPVRLVRSTRVTVPAVAGWLRPVILLPAVALTGLTPAQLEVILAHEIAHIRRHDYLINLFQSVVEILLFYHPAVWWTSRQIRREREHCCDDLALRVTGGDRRLYARALLDLETLRPAPRLAVAASDGSLPGRVRRLFQPESLEVEMFPRRTAAIAAVTIALLVGFGESGNTAPPLPVDRLPAGPDPAVESQDPVYVYSGDASFAERLDWARRTADEEGLGRFWLAYAVRPVRTLDGFIYSDRSRQIRSGSISMRGTIRGTASGLNPAGLELPAHVGALAPDDVVVLLETDSGGSLQAARLSSAAYRVDPAGLPILWLGRATASESVPFLSDHVDDASETWLAEDLVTAIGVHDDATVVVPRLIGWLEGGRADDVRDQAADWLGFHPDPRALDALVRATDADDNQDVAREAAESLGRLDMPEATDALIDVARETRRPRVRREAVESLGDRTGDQDRVFDVLLDIARTDPDEGVQREAVEVLAELPSDGRTEALAELIRDHPRERVRVEAIEALAEVAEPGEVIELLERRAIDADDRTAREAVETIGDLEGEAAELALRRFVAEHPGERVQRAAVEALAERGGPGVSTMLAGIARDHPRSAVRREAVERLAETSSGDEAVPVLVEIATQDPEERMRREAVEALGELGSPAAVEAIGRLMTEAPDERTRREAIESYGEAASDPQGAAVLRDYVTTADSRRLQEEALEALLEMDHDAGLEAVLELARSAPDRSTRLLAIEALGESDDPRALDALDALIPG